MRKNLIILGLLSSVSFCAQNLILNGSFEEWTPRNPPAAPAGIIYETELPNNWFKSDDDTGNIYKSETMKKDGNYGLEVDFPIQNGKMNLRGSNNVGLVNGVTYVYSGWYLDNVDGYMNVIAKFREVSPIVLVEKSENSAEWQYFEIEKKYETPWADEDKVRVDFLFQAEGNLNNRTKMYLDDFRMIDKEQLSVSDIKDFEKGIKLNTQVKEILNIELPSKSTVNLYDLSGKIIFSKRLDGKNDINLSDLNKGNYILQIRNEQHSVSKKIIKL
ncbi:MAG: T9SS type A sorting domain-containing protein [Cruoricaptor ignavus]|nr:T9SS type A sorting domain-containing protein [Cruoricaptor ignavus]